MNNSVPSYKTLTKSVFLVLAHIVSAQPDFRTAKRSVSEFLNTYQGSLTRTEINALDSVLVAVLRRVLVCGEIERDEKIREGKRQLKLGLVYDQIVTACRVVCRNEAYRAKQERLEAELSDPNCLFFVCSVHYPCADDHKELQGKVYVDSGWRRKATGDTYRAVSDYIKTHNIMTVQTAMKQYGLCTRRNCKHRFYPISSTVPPSEVTAPRQRDHTWNKSVRDELKEQVYNIIDRIV